MPSLQENKTIIQLKEYYEKEMDSAPRPLGRLDASNGPDGEAPTETSTFIKLMVSERVGISRDKRKE